MVGSRILLFLWGATIANCLALQNGKLCKHGDTQHALDEPIKIIAGHVLEDLTSLQPTVLPSVRVPSFAPPFIQQGTNLFYKPQFMTPGNFIPTAISNVIHKKEENLPKPEMAFPETLYISQVPTITILNEMENSETKPVKIPEAPELPVFANELFEVQSPARPIIVEEPAIPMDLPQPPKLPLSFTDVLPPVLPPFTMPALPVLSGIPTGPETNLIEIPEPPMLPPTVNLAIPDVETEILSEPIRIPDAPTLPPFIKPELPVHVTVPAAPGFPSFLETKPVPLEISVSCFPESYQITPVSELKPIPPPPELTPIQNSNIPALLDETFKQEHVVIPEAPELPPISNSVIPEVIEYEPIPIEISKIPALLDETFKQEHVVIPEAPELPPISNSVIPEVIEYKPIPIEISKIPALLDETFKQEHVVIPEAPELPPISNSVTPEVIEYKPIHIPQAPQLPLFTLPELPTVIINKPVPISFIPEKPYQDIPPPPKEIPAPPVLPFLPQLIPTFAETPEQALNFKPMDIPSAPELPPLTMPTIPVPIVIEENNEELCDEDTPSENAAPTVIIPEVPLVASGYSQLTQPIFWAQNIIIERVLPHIFVSEKDHMNPVNCISCSIPSSH